MRYGRIIFRDGKAMIFERPSMYFRVCVSKYHWRKVMFKGTEFHVLTIDDL